MTAFLTYAASLTGTLTWGCAHACTGLEIINNAINAGSGTTFNSKGLILQETFQGSASGQLSFNVLNVSGDTAATTQGALAVALEISYSFGGASLTGNRAGLNVNMTMTAASGNTGGQSYGCIGGQLLAQTNDGGTAPTIANARASNLASNFIATLANGATNWYGCHAQELDVNVQTGASVAQKRGLLIAQLSTDKVQGSVTDAAIGFSNQNGAVGWNNGIQFGSNDTGGVWPFVTTASIMSAINPGTVTYGIDLSNITFAVGGAGFLAPLTTPSSSAAAGKAGSIIWDANFIYICTATNTWKRAALSTF